MKKIGIATLALILVSAAAISLPLPLQLELYDVQDLTYTLDDWSVDIRLAGSYPEPILEVDLLMVGPELAERLRLLAPTSDVPIQFQNGLIIVRGTLPQHLAIRTSIAAIRARNTAVTWAIDAASRAKAALSAALSGMITR